MEKLCRSYCFIDTQLTIQGSSIAGFNGAVTITNNNPSYTLGANADNIVIQNLTIGIR